MASTVEEVAMAELVISDAPGTPANPPALAIEPDPSGVGSACVSARNLRPDLVASLGRRVQSVLRVKVAEAGAPDDKDLPDVFGHHEILDDGLRFIPHFPFGLGVRFRAILDLRSLDEPDLAELITLDFLFPKETGVAATEVRQVFPSNDVLPENLLRLYVCFSKPMQRGRAEANIKILDPDGRPAPDILYRAPLELWDRSMTCLTILLDPGRLKRGVGPNRMLGPPLRAGQRYTLAVGPGMFDMCGRSLRRGFNKSFNVAEAVREPVVIEEWKIRSPAIGGRQPLELIFPRPLDWAQLWHGITVASESDQPVSGRIDIDPGETRWRFTPNLPWEAGAYSVRVSPGLEDVCGNTLYGPFDGPFRSADDVARERAIHSILFDVERREGEAAESSLSPADADLGAHSPNRLLRSRDKAHQTAGRPADDYPSSRKMNPDFAD
jgi:hypothetical protein